MSRRALWEGIFRALLKIALEIKDNLWGYKNSLKRCLGNLSEGFGGPLWGPLRGSVFFLSETLGHVAPHHVANGNCSAELFYFGRNFSPCRKRSPGKGVRQKSDEKRDRNIKKVTEKWPKASRKRKKWSNSFCRTPFAAPWIFRVDFPPLTFPKQLNGWVANPRVANPRVAERAPRRSAKRGVAGGL